jgi:hypothetical protein
MTQSYGVEQYCLACCSANRPTKMVDESWRLVCDVTQVEAARLNAFGFEFRTSHTHIYIIYIQQRVYIDYLCIKLLYMPARQACR